MKRKAKNLIIAGILIIGLIGIYSSISSKAPEIHRSKISASSFIDYPSELNYRQTTNDCGPFNVAAVVRTLTNSPKDSAEFAKKIEGRLPNKYTLPWGMEKQLRDNNLNIEIPNMGALSDEDKIAFLQEQLSLKKPIIILGARDNYQHYLTIFGFNKSKDEFYIYDSLFEKGQEGFTQDENSSLPGNRNYSSEELLNFWRGGGMYGVYNWYAIVSDKQ
jgi:hypothetical protein